MTYLEICCFDLKSALLAKRAGADRIELCSGSPANGGLTPDRATLLAFSEGNDNVSNRGVKPPQVMAMIRPRAGDFVYSGDEFKQMRQDIETLLKIQACSGAVFGILTSAGDVNVERCTELIELVSVHGGSDATCTFHRAFDEVRDMDKALEDVVTCGFSTVLTSGGKSSAVEGVELLARLVQRAKGRIQIMLGGGVRAGNMAMLREKTGVQWMHSSAIAKDVEGLDERELWAMIQGA